MTSERRQAARANGRAGRGRKSAAGKAASARNAFRHGLSLPLLADPTATAEVAALARAITPTAGTGAGDETSGGLAELARRIAEAQLDLVRVRRARRDLIAAALAGRHDASSGSAADQGRIVEIVTEFAKRQGALSASILHHIAALVPKTPAGPEHLARILGRLTPRLNALDRYEHRARSRRTRASVAYDHKKMLLKLEQS